MKVSSWGALVAQGLGVTLAAGCSSQARVAEPAPPAPPVASEAPPPAPPPPKGPPALKPLLQGVRSSAQRLEHGAPVVFGRGQIVYADLGRQIMGREPPCLVGGVDREGCHFFRVATFDKPEPAAVWRQSPAPVTAGAWSSIKRAPHRWGSLSGGQEVVYAVREEGNLSIDVIDDKGAVKELFKASSGPHLHAVQVVELGGGNLIVVGDDEHDELTTVELARSSSGLAMGAVTQHKIATASARGTASYARAQASRGNRVSFGELVTVPMLGASGEPEKTWLLAWAEAIAPPKYTPAGVPFDPKAPPVKGQKVAPKVPQKTVIKIPPKGAKHGCGRRSRSLLDASVEKKTHLMKMSSSGAVLEDKIVAVAPLSSSASNNVLHVRLVNGGFELNGVRFDNNLAQQQGAAQGGDAVPEGPLPQPAFEGPVPATIQLAAFDAESGEGIVVGHERGGHDSQVMQRFDAAGEPTSVVAGVGRYFNYADREVESLVRVKDGWVVADASAMRLYVLSGPKEGKEVQLPHARGWFSLVGVVRTGEQRVRVVRAANAGGERQISLVDVDTERLEVVGEKSIEGGGYVQSSARSPGEPGALYAAFRRAPPGRGYAIGKVDAQGAYAELFETKVFDNDRRFDHIMLHPLQKGVVATRIKADGVYGVWLSSPGKEEQLGAPVPQAAPGEEPVELTKVDVDDRWSRRGPFVMAGKRLVGEKPGAVRDAPAELAALVPGCPFVFANGKGKALMLCTEAVAEDKVGAVTGARVVELPAP